MKLIGHIMGTSGKTGTLIYDGRIFMKIYLLRHGEKDWNRIGRVRAGRTCQMNGKASG